MCRTHNNKHSSFVYTSPSCNALTYDILISIIYFPADAHNTFNLFDKKGNGQVSTKELGNIFKSLALQIPADRLKEWADEVDEEGMYYYV